MASLLCEGPRLNAEDMSRLIDRGVNLGGDEGGHVPQEFGVATPMYNVPSRF